MFDIIMTVVLITSLFMTIYAWHIKNVEDVKIELRLKLLDEFSKIKKKNLEGFLKELDDIDTGFFKSLIEAISEDDENKRTVKLKKFRNIYLANHGYTILVVSSASFVFSLASLIANHYGR